MADDSTTRCGRISYTNDLPVYAAFDLGAMPFPGELRPGVPAELNRALLDGELDISPISSLVFARHRQQLIHLPDLCIASRQEVHSIVCISAVTPRGLEKDKIAVTKESATGRALFDVICRERYGFAPQFYESDRPMDAYRDGGTCLLIGDAALDASFEAPSAHVHDVGLLWHEFTGLGMIYALWAARRDFGQGDGGATAIHAVRSALGSALEYGESHIDRVIELAQQQHPRPVGFYEYYYKSLSFHVDVDLWRGFNKFLEYAGRHQLVPDIQLSMVTQ
jgi:chorismate dehydratase